MISSATSLRVLLMLLWSSTLLRDVLLSWMLYFDASRPLNEVPSKPAVPHTSVMRVGSRKNSSSCTAFSAVSQFVPGVRKSSKPDGRNSAGHHRIGAEHAEILRDDRVLGTCAADREARSRWRA